MPAATAPLVSVVVTCFNSEHYIGPTLDSILANARPDLPIEILAVNDKSTDGTVQVLRRFGDAVRIIDKSVNEGVSAARNTGISLARGQYVAFCDHDDLWEPQKLELQLARFTHPDVALVCSDALCFNDTGVIIPSMAGPWLRRGHVFPELLGVNFVITSSVVMRRDVFAQVGVFDPSISHSEDLDLWLRVARRFEIEHVNQPLVRYRSSATQLSSSKLKMKDSRTRIIRRYAAELGDRKLARKVVSAALYHYAMDYWYAGDMRNARAKLIEAAQVSRGEPRYVLRALATFISPQFRSRLARLGRAGRLPSIAF